MAIDVQHAVPDDDLALNTDINTTPLVDVMLVMLIIFLVTIPVIVKTIPVQLPTYRNIVTQTKPENIVIAVDKNENIYLNNDPTPVTEAQIRDRMVQALKDAVAAHRRQLAVSFWGASRRAFRRWASSPSRARLVTSATDHGRFLEGNIPCQ